MITLTRRQFLRRIAILPAMVAAPLAQWPTSDPAPEPDLEKDTPLGLAERMATSENRLAVGEYNDLVQFNLLQEHGRALIELFKRTPPPMMFWPQRRRRG